MRKRLVIHTYTYWTLLLIALILSEKGESAPTTLDSLPRDLIYNVQEYLDLDDYKAMRSVSKNMYDRLGFFDQRNNWLFTINNHNAEEVAKKTQAYSLSNEHKIQVVCNIEDCFAFLKALKNKESISPYKILFCITQKGSYNPKLHNVDDLPFINSKSIYGVQTDGKTTQNILDFNSVFSHSHLLHLRHANLNEIECSRILEFKKTESLGITNSGMKTSQLKLLCQENFYNSLRELRLENNKLCDESCFLISKNFQSLKKLNLSCNGITDLGIWYLSTSPILKNIEEFAISYNPLEDNYVGYLDKDSIFSQAKTLDFRGIQSIKDHGKDLLQLFSKNAVSLTHLYIDNVALSEEVEPLYITPIKTLSSFNRRSANREMFGYMREGQRRLLLGGVRIHALG